MNTNTTQTTSRNSLLDALKIISTFLVIFNHSTSHVWTSYTIDTFTWKFLHFFFLFCRVSIPIFFMCSGAGMLRKEHSISKIFQKNIFQLLKIYVVWMLVYGIVSCVSLFRENLATPRTCINALIKNVIFGQYHTWFLLTLLSLYLITPFLSQITRTTAHTRYFLILSAIFTIVFPCLRRFQSLDRLTNTLNNFDMHFVYGYILYYVAGYYLATLPWKKIYSYISVVVFILSYGFTYFYSMKVSLANNAPYQETFSEFSPFMFLTAISLFCAMRGLENKFTSPLIRPLIGYGYALYLMHPLFLPYVQKLPGLYAILGAFGLYLGCLLICFFLSKSKLLSYLFLK